MLIPYPEKEKEKSAEDLAKEGFSIHKPLHDCWEPNPSKTYIEPKVKNAKEE